MSQQSRHMLTPLRRTSGGPNFKEQLRYPFSLAATAASVTLGGLGYLQYQQNQQEKELSALKAELTRLNIQFKTVDLHSQNNFDNKTAAQSADYIQRTCLDNGVSTLDMPKVAIVLGSAQGAVAEELLAKYSDDVVEIDYKDVPGMSKTTVSGHKGRFLLFKNGLLVVDGRKHYYETRNSAESAFYVRILANLGIQQLILTNASGSLDKTHCPKGSVGLITDFDTNIPDPRLGTAKFVALTNIVSADLNSTLKQLADGLNITLKEGAYYANQGPSYETRSNIDGLRARDFKYVGMSSVPEAMVAAEYPMQTACLTLATNDCIGLSDATDLPPTHGEVKEAGQQDRSLIQLLLHIDTTVRNSNDHQLHS